MNKAVKKLLASTALYATVTSVIVLSAPHIMNYAVHGYRELQIEDQLRPFHKGETNASRTMMKSKKKLVVNILSDMSSGSGDHISKNVILTARHVAEDLNKDSLVKTSINGKVEVRNVTGVVMHPTLDIALVLIGDPDVDKDNLLIKFRKPVDEEKVFRIGFSKAKAMNSSEGRYEADESPSEEKLTGDFDIFYVGGAAGDSGSIIFGADGSGLGMVNAGPSDGLQEAKEAIQESGLDQIPDDETSLSQDNMKTLSRDNITLGYGRNLAKGVDDLIDLLMKNGASFPAPKLNLMKLFMGK